MTDAPQKKDKTNKKTVFATTTKILTACGIANLFTGPEIFGFTLIGSSLFAGAYSLIKRAHTEPAKLETPESKVLLKTSCALLSLGVLTLATLKGVVIAQNENLLKDMNEDKQSYIVLLAKNFDPTQNTQSFGKTRSILDEKKWGLDELHGRKTLIITKREGPCITVSEQTTVSRGDKFSTAAEITARYCEVRRTDATGVYGETKIISVMNY